MHSFTRNTNSSRQTITQIFLSLIAGIQFAIWFCFGGHQTWIHSISFANAALKQRRCQHVFFGRRNSIDSSLFLNVFFLITVKCLFNWNFISKQSMKEEFRFFLSCFCCHFTQPTATGVCMFFFRCFHCFVSFSRYFFSLSLFCVFSFLFFFLRIFCFRSRWHCWHRYQRMFSEHYTKIDKRNGLSENVFVNWNRKLLQTKCDHFNCH